jgi:hypothetical protein
MQDTTENIPCINKEDFDRLIALQEKIKRVAEKIKDLYCEIRNDSTAEYLEFVKVDGECLLFEGHEYWAYGEYDRHTLEIPTKYLYDPTWYKKESATAAAMKIDMEKRIEEQRLKYLEQQKIDELELLKELKEKYEGQPQ